jgi:PTH1 family peptidyl-tRNA hydrolase
MELNIIIGLGNPGEKYETTFHNVGFLAVDYLKEHRAPQGIKVFKSKTFMNESGKFVKEVLRKNGASPEHTLIIHDDSDLVIGDYKIGFGQGSAGHRGVQNIIKTLGTKDFWRLRIGIRRETAADKENPRLKASSFVLNNIPNSDMETLQKTFALATSKILSPQDQN